MRPVPKGGASGSTVFAVFLGMDIIVGSLSHSAIFQKASLFITPDFSHSAIFKKAYLFITPDFSHSAIFQKG